MNEIRLIPSIAWSANFKAVHCTAVAMTMNLLFEIHLQFLHRLEGDGLGFSPSQRVMMKLWSLTAGDDAAVESLWNTWGQVLPVMRRKVISGPEDMGSV